MLVRENVSVVLYVSSEIYLPKYLEFMRYIKRSILYLLNHFITVCKVQVRYMSLGATKLLLPTY